MKERPTLTAADLRPEVLAFAFAMEHRLREHDDERGGNSWQVGPVDVRALAREARFKVGMASMEAIELKDAGRVLYEAADAANYVMIIADVCGGLQRDVLRIMDERAPASSPIALTEVPAEVVERAMEAFYPNWHRYQAGYRQAKYTRWAKALNAILPALQPSKADV